MNDSVSVRQALQWGKWLVMYTSFVLFTGIFWVGILKSTQKWLQLHELAVIGIFTGLGLLITTLYWGYAYAAWRNWAFANVRNVHELRQKAIFIHLMYDDDSWQHQWLISTSSQKARWAELERRFDIPDVLEDDPMVEIETRVYYSKWTWLLGLLALLGAVAGIFSLFKGLWFSGGVLVLICGYSTYNWLQQALNTAPQIILNDQGIETAKNGFTPWTKIYGEQIVMRGSGKYTRYYLVYTASGRVVEVDLYELSLDYETISDLLIVYRVRFEQERKVRISEVLV